MKTAAKRSQKPDAEADLPSTCSSAKDTPRHAVAVDGERKAAAVRRLRRIAGQIRGLEAMVADERYCADILVQIASVQEALRGLSRLLMRNHLEHCATSAIQKGGEDATAMYDELLDLVYRHAR